MVAGRALLVVADRALARRALSTVEVSCSIAIEAILARDALRRLGHTIRCRQECSILQRRPLTFGAAFQALAPVRRDKLFCLTCFAAGATQTRDAAIGTRLTRYVIAIAIKAVVALGTLYHTIIIVNGVARVA